MAEFHTCVTTTQGLNLIALSHVTKCPLVLTKMAIGDSRPTDTTTSSISAMTKLVDEKLTSDITSLKKIKNADTTDGRYAAFGKFANTNLTAGFNISEVGLYAKVESSYYTDSAWDGYTGAEVLLCYGYADEGKTDYLPGKDTPMSPQEIGVYVSVGNAETVSVHISDTQVVSETEFQAHLTDTNAHKDFVGCSETLDGVRGFVPKPTKGQTPEYYLNADGTWKQVKQRSIKDVIDIVYPVGAIYTTIGTENPNEKWSGTTWERFAEGRVLLGAGTYTENGTTYTYTAGNTGGQAKHQLTADEMPAHSHSASSSTANLTGSMSNSNQDSLTTSADIGTSGIVSKGTGWGHYGGQASGDGATTSLTINASHSHSISVGSTGGNGLHENRQPYIAVNFWKRTA